MKTNGKPTPRSPGSANAGQITSLIEPVYTPIFPDLNFDSDAYAHIQMRLDLYEDMIVATHYDNTEPGASFVVDPMDLAAALGDLPFGSGLLPKNCLFWSKRGGHERLAVYIEPQVWAVSIERDKRTWHVPLPGLVFLGHEQRYEIYAVKEEPTADNLRLPVCIAPVPNMTPGSRSICQGNAPFPVAASGTIWQAVSAFFESGFNEHLVQNKSQKYPDNILRMWRILNRVQATEYPLDDLVSHHMTIRDLLREER